MDQPRTQAGIPAGGQFTSRGHAEATVALLDRDDLDDYYDSVADSAESASPAEALSGWSGQWFVDVTNTKVVAGKRDGSLTSSADICNYKSGRQVGMQWTPKAPPKNVIALATVLTARLP
jgi:hypothetical protein